MWCCCIFSTEIPYKTDPAAFLAARTEPHKRQADPQGDPLCVKLTKRRNQKPYTAVIKLQHNRLCFVMTIGIKNIY